MQFSMTDVDGAVVIDLEPQTDERGFFARSFCAEEFASIGLDREFPQSNISHNTYRRTLRGMHAELPIASGVPSNESKLVRCTNGAIYDVVVDLREGSPTHLRWAAVELSRANGRALYVPAGCAHGFLTLVDDVDVHYQMGSPYRPGAGFGVRWDDPLFAIDWPFAPMVISERDATYPDYAGSASAGLDDAPVAR